ncbi:histidine kinase, partial [Cellulomonas sp. RIT-PI-Y]|uniref:sensor histidine kinase n=1 Tax=Cellulomonas sp. RIT-PI-Y TaxID=3035297 RepID=UPI0021D881EA
WSRTWRYLVAVGTGLTMWLVTAVDLTTHSRPQDAGKVGALLLLDLVLGAAATALLPLRRRLPVVTALVSGILLLGSVSAGGPATVALVSLSTRRRWREALPAAGVWLVTSVGYESLYRQLSTSTGLDGPVYMLLVALLGAMVCGLVIATGFYIGARRELLASLRQRAEEAERTQRFRVDRARQAERTRIAREMHDVLAHRISLVAMQAGGLAYRQDLTREQITESAEQIRDGAHRALGELREVLGVLRATGGDVVPTEHEAPQPTLAEVPALLADAVEAGGRVHLDPSGLPQGDLLALTALPETVSRTAFRILQEALTNARKHAPGQAVLVRMAGEPGEHLLVEARNQQEDPSGRMPSSHDGTPGHGSAGRPSTPPGAGLGLVGAQERAELVGGRLEHGSASDGTYAVRVWLPWPI